MCLVNLGRFNKCRRELLAPGTGAHRLTCINMRAIYTAHTLEVVHNSSALSIAAQHKRAVGEHVIRRKREHQHKHISR